MSSNARRPLALAGLAVLATALAALKPIHIDEASNYYFAAHIASQPLDPYGFEAFWYQWPQPANEVLTPPVLVYWWALAIRWLGPLGGLPVVWKLWLLPFTMVFVFSLHALCRRFAAGLALPLTVLTVLSPAFLPSLNLMPDIPEMACGLLAVVVFLRAADRGSYGLAVLAGLLAGLAIQTKYTGFLIPAVLLLRAVLVRKPALGVAAGVVGALVFVGWEALVALKYGESHFLHQLRQTTPSPAEKVGLGFALLPTLGGVAPVVGLLGLAALGVRRRGLVAAGLVVVLGYALLVCVGADFVLEARISPFLEATERDTRGRCTLATPVFGLLGLAFAVVGGWLARVTWRSDPSVDGRFLVLWLALEFAGYFTLTPFPAVRRVLGLIAVLTLLAGRMASRPEMARLVRGLAAASTALGLLFLAADWCDARAQQIGAEGAAERIRAEGGGRAWYAGHWGFQFYAERAGMMPVVPDASPLKAGDWLVLPGRPVERQMFILDAERSEPAFQVLVSDALPLRTVMGYYGGFTPLDHRHGPRLRTEVRRITADWEPVSSSDLEAVGSR